MISGKLEKWWIEAYSKDDFSSSSKVVVEGESRFYVQVNPETYKKEYRLKYVPGTKQGTANPQKYIGTEPQKFSVELLFDGTGVVQNGSNAFYMLEPSDPSKNDITPQIQLLKQFCHAYDGNIHRPRYLKLCWGTEEGIFKGVLHSMSIDYKLFKPDGTPLRATVKLDLESVISEEEAELREDNQSPDITHLRIFKGGDRFPLMVKQIYDSQAYYIDVAKANGMLSFRKIKQGTSIQFPPIK